jgi:hypothetical protein
MVPTLFLVLLVNDSEYSRSTGAKPILSFSCIYLVSFWYFWLTIQNTADRQVRNLFCLLAVFISFPLARCAPLPHLAPLFEGGKVPKKEKKENRGRGRGRFVFVALLLQDLSLKEPDPRPKGPGPGFSDFIFAYCAMG